MSLSKLCQLQELQSSRRDLRVVRKLVLLYNNGGACSALELWVKGLSNTDSSSPWALLEKDSGVSAILSRLSRLIWSLKKVCLLYSLNEAEGG